MVRDFTSIPSAWIDRIFERMQEIYGEKWISHIGKPDRQKILKSIWSVALMGCDADDIKRALILCERFPHSGIPTHIAFYHYAKGIKQPDRYKPPMESRGSQEVANHYLDQIRGKLRYKGST